MSEVASESSNRRTGRILRSIVGAATAVGFVAGATVAFEHSAVAAPAFQLPFPWGEMWRLNTWDSTHAPSLDMVREPQSTTEGSVLVAPAAGRVNQSFLHDNAGNMIQIDHGGGHFTTYIHLQSRAVGVGAQVRQGQTIGRVGHTGPTSNGVPHLHYEQGLDRNGDGRASWGFQGAERVAAVFNGLTYGPAAGGEWRNVASRNSCPPEVPVDNGTVQFADLSGDGRDELISILPNGDVRAYLNLGWEPTDTYTGSANKVVAKGFTNPGATKFADLNGDGRAEIIAIAPNGDVRAYLNLGWEPTDTFTGSANKVVARGFTVPVATKFADINGDNRDEILSMSNGDVRAYLNLGWEVTDTYTGSASKLVAQGFTNPVSTKFADINGDNRDEIIAITGGGGDVRAYLNLGWEPTNTYTGSANKLVAQGFTNPVATKFGDLNGDNRDEIITIDGNGGVRAYLNLGWEPTNTYTGSANKLVAQGFRI